MNVPLLDLVQLDKTVRQSLFGTRGRSEASTAAVLFLSCQEDFTFQSSCSIRRTRRPPSDCTFSLSLASVRRSSQTLVSSLKAGGKLETLEQEVTSQSRTGPTQEEAPHTSWFSNTFYPIRGLNLTTTLVHCWL